MNREAGGRGDEAPIPGLDGLELDALPQRDLWPDIEARLRPRRPLRRSGWIGYAAAASVAALVGIGLWEQRQDPVAGGVAQETAALPRAERATLMPYAPRESRALVKANLKIVDDAESQLRHALELDPESESLRRLLVSAQRQRRDLQRLVAQGT